MKVVVIGAGVIGVTTAWYLRQAGCEVTVLERHASAAEETSFANAGQVSPGYAAPWAAPGIPLKALKWLMSSHAPLRIHPDGSGFQLRWLAAMLANCIPGAYARNKGRMVALAEYSRDQLRELRQTLGLHYQERSLGTLQLLRTEAQMAAARRDAAILADLGVPHEVLDMDELETVEPALEPVAHKLVGGLRLPNDETGDCHLFTKRLEQLAQAAGVEFRYLVEVTRLGKQNGRISYVELDDGEALHPDAVVLACGSFSRQLALPLGLSLPVYPVKGYSLTIPLTDADAAPRSTVLDETYKVALTRFDDRLRVGGMAELMGYDHSLDPRRIDTLKMVARDLFPQAGDVDSGKPWSGLRPMTPDGTPLVCGTDIDNLYLNTGHGTLGWTMACGSARVLADLIQGRVPDIDAAGLALSRYQRRAQNADQLAPHDGEPAAA
ncbi:D-amino acid dehydrogenase [Chitiniphilus eburneus]|uniref:D-amino acid dehydrogenase n=1 Tax=Chitiniphilus eburneus TaxID=2571148 RepID=A0A4U0QNB4_9NEIS|nr:D-amino acid dehydrogenase [Chitiniphilus eburneus]TJZ77614.1 D-amino acid dehydrogenase [Chitiniphilus eburneus]